MINIAHKKRYENSKTKKYKMIVSNNKFVNQTNGDYGIVIETNYHEAEILYQDKIIKIKLDKTFNTVCNKTIFPGDKVILNQQDETIKNIVQKKK